MGDPICDKIKTFVSYLLVGMGMYTFCGFADAPLDRGGIGLTGGSWSSTGLFQDTFIKYWQEHLIK
jgi:hypothetical protein